jgi:hypothetical protein
MGFFSNLFKDEELSNIDDKIDNLLVNLPNPVKSSTVDSISGEFISSFLDESPIGEVNSFLQSVAVSKERLERYAIYDETYKYVPIIKRILSVYISNILLKNPITGKCILIKETDSSDNSDKGEKQSNIEKSKKLADDIIDQFELVSKLRKKILPNEMCYGDCYVEIINISEEGKKPLKSDASLSLPIFESEISNIDKELNQYKAKRLYQSSSVDNMLNKISEYLFEIQEFQSESNSKSKSEEEDTVTFDNVIMRIHKPHNIIVLESSFGNLLGYLYVSSDRSPQTINLTQSLSTLVGRITTLHGNDSKFKDSVTDRLIKYILRNILIKYEKNGKLKPVTNIDDLLRSLPDELHLFMKRLIIGQDLVQKSTSMNKVQVRFISPEDMVPFSVPSSEYDPYGQSFIDSLIFPCKLYILAQLSNVIIKLSRAAPVRKWTIDVGQTQMQAGMIQKLKRELYNTRVTLDDLSSFKSIPKLLSD